MDKRKRDAEDKFTHRPCAPAGAAAGDRRRAARRGEQSRAGRIAGAITGAVTAHLQPEGGEKSPKLVLESNRGKRVHSSQNGNRCAECGMRHSLTWHYEKSSIGPVHICSGCKPKVFDRSFGKRDAMEFADPSGGFESNRRRH